VPRLIQHGNVILLGEVRSQQPDSGEVDVSGGKAVKDDRESANGASGLDSIVRCVLREMEHLGAVGKQRGEAFRQVEPPFIEDREMRDENGGGRPLLKGEFLDPGNELPIGQARSRKQRMGGHACVYITAHGTHPCPTQVIRNSL
jgi:hypothetical protein